MREIALVARALQNKSASKYAAALARIAFYGGLS